MFEWLNRSRNRANFINQSPFVIRLSHWKMMWNIYNSRCSFVFNQRRFFSFAFSHPLGQGGEYLIPYYHILSKIRVWASYQIRKIAGYACAGNAGNVFPRRWFQRKPLVSDPGMHHGACVTHVPWCMSGSLTCGDGENVPGIPDACAPAILRIWQGAHGGGCTPCCFI